MMRGSLAIRVIAGLYYGVVACFTLTLLWLVLFSPEPMMLSRVIEDIALIAVLVVIGYLFQRIGSLKASQAGSSDGDRR